MGAPARASLSQMTCRQAPHGEQISRPNSFPEREMMANFLIGTSGKRAPA